MNILEKIKQSVKDYFTPKTEVFYLKKRKDKYFGLNGCYYIKKKVVLPTEDILIYRIEYQNKVYTLLKKGYKIITEDEYNNIK